MRMSTAHSLPEEDEELRAPASGGSSLTQGNLDYMTASASAAGKLPPSPSVTLQVAGSPVAGHTQQQQKQQQQQQQQQQEVLPPAVASQPSSSSATSQQQTQQQQQQMSHVSLPKGQTVTSPVQQAEDVHPLQVDLQQPAATSTQEGTRDANQLGTSDGVQAQDQNLGTSAQAKDGEGMSGGAAFGVWACAEQHSEWAVMEWVASEALPALIGAVRMVGPYTETEALRYQACLFVRDCMCVACLFQFAVVSFSCIVVCLSQAPKTNWRQVDNCSGCDAILERQNTSLCRRLCL